MKRQPSRRRSEASRVAALTKEAKQMRDSGMTLERIGHELGGYRKATVHGWLNRKEKDHG